MNSIKNCSVTTEDIDLAKKTYGPDAESLTGKTVHQSPAPVVNGVIEIPRELIASHNKNTELSLKLRTEDLAGLQT